MLLLKEKLSPGPQQVEHISGQRPGLYRHNPDRRCICIRLSSGTDWKIHIYYNSYFETRHIRLEIDIYENLNL